MRIAQQVPAIVQEFFTPCATGGRAVFDPAGRLGTSPE
jgi:hypothetical protein